MTNDLKGPSVPHLLLCFSFFLLNIVSFQVQILPNFDGYTDKNFYGFLFGGFFGVIALARFEYVDALRVRSRKSFEWTLISAKKQKSRSWKHQRIFRKFQKNVKIEAWINFWSKSHQINLVSNKFWLIFTELFLLTHCENAEMMHFVFTILVRKIKKNFIKIVILTFLNTFLKGDVKYFAKTWINIIFRSFF